MTPPFPISRKAKLVGSPSSKLFGEPGGTTLSQEELEAITRRLVNDNRPTTSSIIATLPTPDPNYPIIPGIGKGNPTLEFPEQLTIPDMWAAPDPTKNIPLQWETPDYGFWEGIQKGLVGGVQYGVSNNGIRTRSALLERAPTEEYKYLPPQGQAAYAAGRIAADVAGHGTRQWGWRMHPEDIISSIGHWYLNSVGGNKLASTLGGYSSSLGMGIGSGNYNPLNPTEGGRPDGFQAISPDDEDPRKSTNPIYDLVVERGFFGRKGRLLPWEQFHEERPDVSYDKYSQYKDYLSNKDNNLLRNLTLGMAKGTLDGINGPEVQLMGYSVTPLGAAAALGTLTGVGAGIKKYAALRKQ